MPLAVKINVALREHNCQKIGSERVHEMLRMVQFSWGYNFRGFRGGSDPRIFVPTKKAIFCMNYKGTCYGHEF